MPRPDDIATLRAGAAALGSDLDAGQAGRLLAFRDLLAHRNRIHNLTALRDPQLMLTHHLMDSVSLLAPLQRQRAGQQATRLLDVGSGGGLPGVVLAIAWPDLQVVCVDAIAKKVGFIREIAAQLKLTNLRAAHARVESLQEQPFDVITSRAFASLPEFVTLTRRLLAQGGVWVAMKGKRPDAEIAALPADVEVFHVEPLTVPGLGAERCLVWIAPVTLEEIALDGTDSSQRPRQAAKTSPPPGSGAEPRVLPTQDPDT
jgi:16S rRNA (guanine527-N7)-methyltransferase